MKKLVIFDLDGTLVNSIDDLADAANAALLKNGFPARSTDEIRQFVGNGAAELLRRALPEGEYNAENAAKMRACFDLAYRKGFAVKTKPYNGIPELLYELKRRGVLLAVASNKPDEFTKAIVSHFFGDTFDTVQGQTDSIPKKPDPTVALEIMRKLNVPKEFTVFAGDSDVDIHTASNSGVTSIGCSWGFRPAETLREAGADFIINSPSEMAELNIFPVSGIK